jgi:hypothetical protein
MNHPRAARLATSGGVSRRAAMKALGSVVYAARLDDGTIKIGWTEHFDERLYYLKQHTKQTVKLIGFQSGSREDEQAIHATLAEHRSQGREYYHPTPEVIAAVNSMRDVFSLPHIAA